MVSNGLHNSQNTDRGVTENEPVGSRGLQSEPVPPLGISSLESISAGWYLYPFDSNLGSISDTALAFVLPISNCQSECGALWKVGGRCLGDAALLPKVRCGLRPTIWDYMV